MIKLQFLKNATVITTLSMLLSLAIGCTGTQDNRPPIEISGTVTLNGQALQEASIQFTSPKTGESAYANLDTSGHYTLTFPKADIGSEYEITITPPVVEEENAMALAEKPKQKTKPKILRKYSNRTTSGLKAKIKQAGKSEFNFDLKGK